MASGRIRRTARRGLAAAALAWVGVATFSVLMAPSATAAPSVTVAIRDLTPPVASVDKGGTVTFVNQIQDKTVKVGGSGLLPTVVDVTARTEVTLRLPSGSTPLAPGAGVTERFDSTCTCSISYTYKYSSSAALTQPLIDAARKLLPALPAPTPFVVNTIVPDLPNPPTVNLPALPEVNVPEPPTPDPAPVPAPPAPEEPTDDPAPEDPQDDPAPEVPEGRPYSYDTEPGPRLTPAASAAAAAFDPARFGSDDGAASGSGGSGSGGAPGSYDGAAVPVFGQLAGLDSPALGEESTDDVSSAARSDVPALPAAALAAVVALAAVTAALIRTHQAHRASPGRHAAR